MAKKESSGCGLIFVMLILVVGLGYGVPLYRHYSYVKNADKHIADAPLPTELLLQIQSEGKPLDEAMYTSSVQTMFVDEKMPFFRNDFDNNTTNKKADNHELGLDWLIEKNSLNKVDRAKDGEIDKQETERLAEIKNDFEAFFKFAQGMGFNKDEKKVTCNFQFKNIDGVRKAYDNFDLHFGWDRISDFQWDRYKDFKPCVGIPSSSIIGNMAVVNFDALLGIGQYSGIVLSALKTYSIQTVSTPIFSSILKLGLFAANTSPGVYGNLVKNQIVSNVGGIFNYVRDGKLSDKREYTGLLEALLKYKDRNFDFKKIIEAERDNTKYLLNHYTSSAFVYMFSMRLKANDPLKEANEIYDMAASGENDKLNEAKTQADLSKNMIVKTLIPDFYAVKKACIETESRLSLLQAWLETRLGKPVTAIDPADGKPVKEATKDGEKFFYCIGMDGKDDKGAGDDVNNF